MKCRQRSYRPGDYVRVKHCAGGYPLPQAVPEGVLVKVLRIEKGGFDVIEFEGREFSVFRSCIVSGWECLRDGRWCEWSGRD